MFDFDDIDNVSPMEDDAYDDVREDEDEDDMDDNEDRDDILGWLDIDSLAGSDSFSNDDEDDDWE